MFQSGNTGEVQQDRQGPGGGSNLAERKLGGRTYFITRNYSAGQIDKSLTRQKAIPVGTSGADGSEAFKSKLKFQVQHEVFRVKVREGRIGEITEILAWYEYINDGETLINYIKKLELTFVGVNIISNP